MAKKTAKTAKRKTTKKTAHKSTKRVTGPNGPAFRNVTPFLVLSDAAKAIEWYKDAFGAKELARMPAPGGKIMHAEILIGDSRVMLSDVFPGGEHQPPDKLEATPSGLHIYHKDMDEIFEHAVEHGATVTMPIDDQFWGDRYGKLRDPFGHSWSFGFKSKAPKAELEKKREEAMAQFAAGQQTQ